jgi:hypothetical protein
MELYDNALAPSCIVDIDVLYNSDLEGNKHNIEEEGESVQREK